MTSVKYDRKFKHNHTDSEHTISSQQVVQRNSSRQYPPAIRENSYRSQDKPEFCNKNFLIGNRPYKATHNLLRTHTWNSRYHTRC